jgi:serine/threonine-protein kinase HipA
LPPGRRYSIEGLKKLAPTLRDLKDLPFSAAEQRREALKLATKMSIQGMQYKLSARLSVTRQCFDIVAQNGKFILKPQAEHYENLPENEDLSMRLAALTGIETPLHGLLYSVDGTTTYFIKRMDRVGHKGKIPLEDFAQLSGASRDTKHDSSVEKVIDIVNRFCTFPKVELVKLFHRLLFNFLIGNEDMHLKNYSLIADGKITRLAPAYDFLNTTIALAHPKEESALPLNGKKRDLTRNDLLVYLPLERMELNQNVVNDTVARIAQSLPSWPDWIERSFLPLILRDKYHQVLRERISRLGF